MLLPLSSNTPNPRLVPDKQGKKADVVLGWGSVEEYVVGMPASSTRLAIWQLHRMRHSII